MFNNKKPNQKLYIALFITVILLSVWWLASLLSSDDKPRETESEANKNQSVKPALSVSTVKPQNTMLSKSIVANGTVAAWQEAIIGSEVNGLAIKEVLVNVGDIVKRGQVLVRFNNSTILADLAQSQANVADAKAAALEAEANASRARTIADSGALSRQQVEQYLMQEASTKARLQAAQAAVNVQQVRLNQTILSALDDGVISARSATVGQVVSPGVELFKMVRQGRIEWRGEFNSADISQVHPNMAVVLSLPDNSEITGNVRTLAPIADSTTRNTTVYVDIPKGSAKPGMFAKGKLMLSETKAQTLPATAIVMRDGFSYVMQVDTNKHIKQAKIKLGTRQGDLIEVLGLPDEMGDYVQSGGAFLTDGDLVNLVKATQ